VEAKQPLQVSLLEDPHEHAVGCAHRQKVEHDRLQRDDDRAERELVPTLASRGTGPKLRVVQGARLLALMLVLLAAQA
jgi:hypothetical protein